jgi:DNA-binding transcriptional MerR regulator
LKKKKKNQQNMNTFADFTRRADHVQGQSASSIFAAEIRSDIIQEILAQNPELAHRCSENNSDANDRATANFEVLIDSYTVGEGRYNSIAASEQTKYERKALMSRYEQWRSYRQNGLLIETEESLAQKAEDDKLLAQGYTLEQISEMQKHPEQSEVSHAAFVVDAAKQKKPQIDAPFQSKEEFALVTFDEEYY